MTPLVIGTAGWSIPTAERAAFPSEGSALERYAARFRGVEINSSFHRSHRSSTWGRWAESVPADFRFSVKLPKEISHRRKLMDCREPLATFLEEVAPLGAKLAVMLVQLPPKLAFDHSVAADFFALLKDSNQARIVCEPRHASWFDDEADELLRSLGIPRVAADPALAPVAARPGGWSGLSYWRLHGSPSMYRSPYGPERLLEYANLFRPSLAAGNELWCMFDNTAASAATGDALALTAILSPE